MWLVDVSDIAGVDFANPFKSVKQFGVQMLRFADLQIPRMWGI